MITRIMEEKDLPEAAKIHALAFVRQNNSRKWLQCSINASPRMLCFVCEIENRVVGYIIWVQKSGFRPEVVLELDQIAVHPDVHNCQISPI